MTNSANWLGRPITHVDHADQLEAAAAIHEFDGGLPRHVAEARAYKDYLDRQALQGAAHHLIGMRAAHAAGDQKSAASHFLAYSAAVKHLGHNPYGEPHESVAANMPHQSVYRHRPHASDSLFLNTVD